MLGQKLREARLLIGKSQSDVARESGLSQRDISQLETNKKEFVPTSYIQYLNNKGVDVNTLYLESENVKLIVKLNVKVFEKKDRLKGSLRQPNILLVPVKARAGYLAGYGDPVYIEKLENYRIPGCDNGNYRMFEIEGDSMHPTMAPGDYVIGQSIMDYAGVKPGHIYIIVSRQEGIIIKRVLNVDKTSGKLTLQSDNVQYKHIELNCANITEIWEFYMLLTSLPAQQDPLSIQVQKIQIELTDLRKEIRRH